MKNYTGIKSRLVATAAAFMLMAMVVAGSASAASIELVSNGGFESGFAGWTITDQAGGSGSWFADTTTTTSFSGLASAGPLTGSVYAVSDQTGPGAHALTQSVTVSPGAASVIFSFDMFINDWSGVGPVVHSSGLDYTSGGTSATNQFATVDLLASGTSALSTTTGVLSNFFVGATPVVSGIPNPYVSYSYDITSLVAGGGTFDIRFAEVDNSGFFNMGIDNVSVLATPVPEPATLSLLGMGLIGLAARARRKKA